MPVSPVQAIDTISDLQAYTIITHTVYVEGYISAGDGGGGFFNWITGTASDDFGTVFNSTVGITGGYWQRVTDGEMATPEWFGAAGDGSTDDYALINACIKWAQTTRKDLLTPPLPYTVNAGFDYGNLWAGVPCIYLSKNYAISQPIILLFGTWLRFVGGTLTAISSTGNPPFPYMLQTQYTGELNPPLGKYFSTRDVRIDGKGFLNGNNIANVGLFTNLSTKAIISGLSIINCTLKKWEDSTIKLTLKSGSTYEISGTEVSSIAVDDIVRIFNATTGLYTRSAFSVAAIDLTLGTVTLDQPLAAHSFPPIDVSGANTTEARWELGGNWTLEMPNQPTSTPTADGKIMRFRIVQPTSGAAYTIKWIGPDSFPPQPHGFFFQAAYPIPTLQTTPGAIDYIEFVFNATTLNWECITG